ncbi:uncharacterized protein LOC113232866 isoform X2 [Hyposmocoma kahamanoa]|uniref:uncharacterized protein LOC113232866 isoform X2 n=1 Tax=Hyposmocoma kahamanoa TaxID=1477025 RepID=UPI000E6D6CD4|nr:uncharacterized protein LOC113232866 isoform X2 [Hyposmocoma kahamanoa]
MNQYQTERRLTWCYAGLALLLALSTICIAIPFNHWKTTLDVCPGGYFENTNCGCIFFGVSTTQYFNGGHNSYCWYAVIAPIPILVYAILLFLFHMYRVCISDVGKYEDEKSTAMEEIEGESIVVSTRHQVTRHNDAVIYCWIPTSCFAAIFCIYNIVHAAIITNGFVRTCTQYRGFLAREIHAAGDHVTVIHFRLMCQAIYDFMDYMQKDTLNSRLGTIINTGCGSEV